MDLQIRCHKKAKEIIDRHFGDLIHEAAYERPEVLDEKSLVSTKNLDGYIKFNN